MTSTVNAVASARPTARYVCGPTVRNASSGPYAEDDRPSAPRPTHASNAMSETLWKTFGWSSRLLPSRTRFKRAFHGSLGSGRPAEAEEIGLSSKPTGLADGLGWKRLTTRRLAALRPDYLGPPFPLR